MHWVIQSNLWGESEFENLLTQLQRQNVSHDIVKIVPFVGEIEPDVNPSGPVFVCGSTSMSKLARRKKWNPGYIDGVDINLLDYYFGKYFLNIDGFTTRLAYVSHQTKEKGWEQFHIRPVSDSKSFAGKVMNHEELDDWIEKLRAIDAENPTVRLKDAVFVSTVKHILAEYRFFVIDGKVITGSRYKYGGNVWYSPQVDSHIFEFAQWIISPENNDKADMLPRAYTLDVADTLAPGRHASFNGLKVIETNSINSAGFYSCDMGKFVSAINDLTQYYLDMRSPLQKWCDNFPVIPR